MMKWMCEYINDKGIKEVVYYETKTPVSKEAVKAKFKADFGRDVEPIKVKQ